MVSAESPRVCRFFFDSTLVLYTKKKKRKEKKARGERANWKTAKKRVQKHENSWLNKKLQSEMKKQKSPGPGSVKQKAADKGVCL